MHEMAVTQAMLNLALEHANGRRITDIYLQVGRLSAVVPESVQIFFVYLSEDTLAEGATLHFQIMPIEMTCVECGQQADVSEWDGQPPQTIMINTLRQGCQCGSRNLRVTGGVGFDMVSLTVV